VIGLYCPDLPPVPGGVSDHTLALARALQAQGFPPAVLGQRGDARRFAPLLCRTGVTVVELDRAVLELGLGTLLVQYVPFLFARRGVSWALCRAVSRLERRGVRLGFIVHEPYVPFTRLPWLITGWPMRWQLRYVVRRAAVVYTPVPRFAEIVRRYARPRTPVRVVPVGSNLPLGKETRAEARRALGLADGTVAVGVFSPAASGMRLDWVDRARAALAGRRDVAWISFGFGCERLPRDRAAGDGWLRVADHAAGTVARAMRALDVALAPYVDGLTLRRSSAMFALAHGVPLVSSTGHLFDPQLSGLAACETTPDGFAARVLQLIEDAAARAALAERAGRYAATASVEALARTIVDDLGRGGDA